MAQIAEILLARGQQSANERRRQGELSNAIWQSLANRVAGVGAGIEKERVEAPIRAQEAEMRGLNIKNAQGEIAAREKATADATAFGAAVTAGMPDEELVKRFPQHGVTFLTGRDALAKGKIKNYDDFKDRMADVTLAIDQLPEAMRPQAYLDKKAEMDTMGLNTATMPKTFEPDWFKTQLAHAKILKPAKTREIKTKDATGAETTQIVEDKPGFTATSAPEIKKYPVKVAGPNGQPIERLVTAAELEKGVPAYKDAPAPSQDVVQIMGPNGVPIWVLKKDAVGKPAAQAPRAVTGAERQVLAYYNRAKDANTTITTPQDGGGDSLEQSIAKAGLLSQGRLQLAPNFLQSDANQSYRQAQRAFTEARLRKESGAAIPTAEYENDSKTYFAQPGDTEKIIEQKRASRETVLNGLKFSAGKAYEEYYGEPNVSPARSGSSSSSIHIGQVVKVNGKNVRVTALHSDGTFDGDDVTK